jgi:hypothetical protein
MWGASGKVLMSFRTFVVFDRFLDLPPKCSTGDLMKVGRALMFPEKTSTSGEKSKLNRNEECGTHRI